ncbi:MAG: carbohydrate ABC transporter permease [Actinomycetota bacterium]|nr:carbohydrate ABC transporter permease [Actinomycetota bacterium]
MEKHEWGAVAMIESGERSVLGHGISAKPGSARRRPDIYRIYGARRPVIWLVNFLAVLFGVYILIPLYWILLGSMKTNNNVVNSFGFFPALPFFLFENLSRLFTYDNGEFGRWLLNTLFYSLSAGVGGTIFASFAGFAFAKYRFTGRRAIMGLVLAVVAVPATALTIPLYLLYTDLRLTNNPLGIILPGLGTAFGAFLMFVYVRGSVPDSVLDAARVDGASESRVFWRVALPMTLPGAVTVLLFTIVGTWNNYFLPLLIFTKTSLFPLTLGLAGWNSSTSSGYGTHILYALIVTGGLVTMLPTIVLFLALQKYWRQGLTLGSTVG